LNPHIFLESVPPFADIEITIDEFESFRSFVSKVYPVSNSLETPHWLVTCMQLAHP
jgi:hypothetical protein